MSIWKELGPKVIPKSPAVNTNVKVNVTGRITALVTAGETIYVGTAQGGIWKTINEGKHWTPTSDNAISLAIGALAMDPNNPEILYAGTGEGNFTGDSQYGLGILKTTNGGKTWELKAKGKFNNDRFFRIAVNPRNSNHIFAATRSGLYRSIDAGESWSTAIPQLAGIAATDTVINPASDIAYAAFKGSGICKISNATDATPSWNRLYNFRPRFDFSRLALGISPSSPQRLYALMSNAGSDDIDQFYHTGDGGESWTQIELPGAYGIGTNGAYNLDVAVNPKNPDIVYLLATSIWKAVRGNDGKWNIRDVGSSIHADNHALAFNTGNDNIIYAGNDGGIYKSINGGDNWDDSINKGLCITQFEFMEQDPKDEKRIIAGTQDNGTVIYEGKPEFYHSADGDGGFVCIDPDNSQNVWHTFNGLRPEISTEGGKFQTWKPISGRLTGDSNFYPPMTLDKTNANNIAIGGNRRLYIDYSKGEGGWTDLINLEQPGDNIGSDHRISAINFVNSNLIYVGTNSGGIYRVTKSENKWTPQPIHSPPFPDRYVWDISTLPRDQNKIIAVVSGFDTPHVFRGEVSPQNNSVTWTDISGTGGGRLPNIPVNALAIDESDVTSNTFYIGTDVGVFCTRDGGFNWMQFSRGLPACQVYDLRLNSSKGLLTAATHGRGMWQWSDNTDPIVVPFTDGRLSLFRVYPTKERIYRIYYKNQISNSAWELDWHDLGLGVDYTFGSKRVVTQLGGALEVFWTEPNAVYCFYQNQQNTFLGMSATTPKWENLGDPVVSHNADGNLEIFFVNSTMMSKSGSISNVLWYTTQNLSNPSAFGDLHYFPDWYWSPHTRPTVARNKDGRLDVFMVDMDHKLYHAWQMEKDNRGQWIWSNWVLLSDTVAGEPVLANNDDGRLELFIVYPQNGRLYHLWQINPNDSSRWSMVWNELNPPSLPRNAPTVVRDGEGRLELFMVGVDDNLYHCWQTTKNGSDKWSKNWEIYTTTLTKWRLTSNPVAGRNADGRLELFMVGMDDKIYHCRQKDVRNSTEWSGWEIL
jgi:photosystem II stability/assembly factor-like uncharacterized protein